MPFVDGYQATDKIRHLFYQYGLDQPIITAVTGHTEQSYVNKAINAGMNSIIQKPVSTESLHKLVTTLGFIKPESNQYVLTRNQNTPVKRNSIMNNEI